MKPIGLLCALLVCCDGSVAAEVSSLRFVPFPKEIELRAGQFDLTRRLTLELPNGVAPALGKELATELTVAGFKAPAVRSARGSDHVLQLFAGRRPKLREVTFRANATADDYVLLIEPNAITIRAPGAEGLFHGAQTLRQVIRANRAGSDIPCLTIRDWPSIRWRAFQDDLTRGPSSTLDNLKLQASLGAFFKQNIFTYYMEYQYAFQKHPIIGPKDGSLTPDELKQLVEFARPLHLNVLGNQQSFGHFTAILRHPEFADLRETDYLLSPTTERSYSLLDDLYSEVMPTLPFEFFNVCCDETDGLGKGPSKPVAEKIGVGGLYVQHIQRLHALVKGKYGKRMMMWGDIILNHPERLKDIPKDVVMLTWGYDARGSFEDQIIPFAKSGFEFFVCPGVNCWNRVLPHFAVATTNIRNFVRDGAKHGAIGVLNTVWDDDGENFNAPNWHGIAWGAECAWNASTTAPEDFNRRIGAVLFGESGAHFGKAIELLSTPGICGLPSADFWKITFESVKASTIAAERERLNTLVAPARAGISELEACQRDARMNGELLDFFLFGARRLELYAQRELDRLDPVVAYRDATQAGSNKLPLLGKAEAALRRSRDAHEALRKRFAELWARENKPYALDWTLNRYRQAVAKYDDVLKRLANARASVSEGRPMPSGKEVGLEIVE